MELGDSNTPITNNGHINTLASIKDEANTNSLFLYKAVFFYPMILSVVLITKNGLETSATKRETRSKII